MRAKEEFAHFTRVDYKKLLRVTREERKWVRALLLREKKKKKKKKNTKRGITTEGGSERERERNRE